MTEPKGVSRRNVLQIMGLSTVGVAGLGAAAACAPATPKNDTGSGGGTSGTGGAAAGTGEYHGAYPYTQPPQGHFNIAGQPFVAVPNAIFPGPYGDLMNLPSGYYQWKANAWTLFLLDSYKLDKSTNTYTLKLKSGLKWADGTPLTSKDYLTTFYCQFALNSPLWALISKIDAPDDTTFTAVMKSPAMVVERYLLRSNIIDTKTYGKYADLAKAIVDAGADTSGADFTKLNSDLIGFKPSKLIPNGPFDYDYSTINATQLSLKKNTSSVLAEAVKFASILLYNGETPTVTPLVLSKDVDYATHGFAVASEKQFQAQGYKILRSPVYSGPAIYFSYDKVPEFADYRVRQALIQAFDHKQNGTVALGESGVPQTYYSGFSDNLVDTWITSDGKGKLKQYQHDPDAAAHGLEAAGWKKQGSGWQLPNGKKAAYELLYPSDYADWSGAAKDLADQMKSFGIPITLHGVVSTQITTPWQKGQYQWTINSWGNSTQPYPYFSFVTNFITNNYPGLKGVGGKGMDFPMSATMPGQGKIDINDMINKSGSGIDTAELQKNITELAIVFNTLLPIIPLFERHANAPALDGVRVAKFPDPNSDIVQNSLYADNPVLYGMFTGTIGPKA
ncbi:ABC transporter substrate-binding protein [Microlunatus endophyticus]|uniref:ABC transporter substrate-binding protein n=1 Tax=Microlunatus endophyticus TaxID=1716077 RepID=A0A917W0A4_9ACTN|nr:ABC transporter substrate-binding protein [Microlunatus endophyticus]GGL51172.1 ABC transporter substrate-binding protein [Microlunatus endophyticus]